MLLAAHAAIAMTAAGTEEGLRLALDGRAVIGQAKGILMERHKISDLEAFMAPSSPLADDIAMLLLRRVAGADS